MEKYIKYILTGFVLVLGSTLLQTNVADLSSERPVSWQGESEGGVTSMTRQEKAAWITDGFVFAAEEAEEGSEQAEAEEGECEEEEELTWSFDADKTGTVPEGWEAAETSGQGTPATWQIVSDPSAPSQPNAVAIARNKNYGRTYNLLIAKGTSFKDVEIELMVKAGTGEEDQGGGPIWRARDANNYYICRWNPLENNFRVYFVKNGRRKQIGSANVETDPTLWHKIEISHVGAKIEASFDGEKLIEVEDSTFLEAGKVGLWTKADAASFFDDLEVEEEDLNSRRRT